ncbi:hypothetical protein TRFO_08512 [Tritrichomonas foetus]|uniref:non-specific serine/threonine protein kinase n=1 Tax=Tritrichomonas foetus TaxID=1144522 RepID=A0A1J4JP14_9EUKA|nr:hypothetical protein TRFO_08512 [Tritrichomonas foetus]|eukprot:OHS99259.1 hypothetical protein TRFO_08512 [Tritrichomonas foetus]
MAQNSPEQHILPNKTKVDRFIIDMHIGHGGYGEIYSVYDEKQKGPYAMKVEMKNAKKHGLIEEVHYLKMLRGSRMFPEFICSGETSDLRYFVMELLGPSISLVRRTLPEQKYTKLTATILAKEMLKCIEELHRRGYVHRDIKPGNFLIRPDRKMPICLIDFGLSRRYADRETGNPIAPRNDPGFIGTCSFASVNAHEGKELGRRDDIFSWFYTVIEMVERRLPWPGSRDREKTYRTKQTIQPMQLCRSLPRQFATIYMKTQGLTFYDRPDYQSYYNLLDRAIMDLGGEGRLFDWEHLPKETLDRISVISLDMGPLPNNNSRKRGKNNNSTSTSSYTYSSSSTDSDSSNSAKKKRNKNYISDEKFDNYNNMHTGSRPPNESPLLKDDFKKGGFNTMSTNDISKHEESLPEHLTPQVHDIAVNESPKAPIAQHSDSDIDQKVNQKAENKNENKVIETKTKNKADAKETNKENKKSSTINSDSTSSSSTSNKPKPKEEKPVPIESPDAIDRETAKKKKKKAKKDHEPGCKGCSIA